MKTKKLLLLIIFLIILYPLYQGINAGIILFGEEEESAVIGSITAYQISIWVAWLILVSISVYYKWKDKKNLFFNTTYGFLLVGFAIFGFFTQRAVNLYELPTRFEDSYTLGVFTALQQVAIAGILTFFIQFSVWIFETKWHRN